jgi:hypothetical protein
MHDEDRHRDFRRFPTHLDETGVATARRDGKRQLLDRRVETLLLNRDAAEICAGVVACVKTARLFADEPSARRLTSYWMA